MLSTQPGSTPLASFKVVSLEHREPHPSCASGNMLGRASVSKTKFHSFLMLVTMILISRKISTKNSNQKLQCGLLIRRSFWWTRWSTDIYAKSRSWCRSFVCQTCVNWKAVCEYIAQFMLDKYFDVFFLCVLLKRLNTVAGPVSLTHSFFTFNCRICTIRSVDGSKIMAYCVNECDGSSGMGSRPRRYLFTGHSNGCIQVKQRNVILVTWYSS